MIPREVDAEIRRLFFAEHWRVHTIAEALSVHQDTVRHAIEQDRFVRTGPPIRPSQLDPYKPFITATLEQYPRLRATRLFAMIGDRGYRGSVVQLRRYVRTVRPQARAEAYLRLETLPGEQAQVDWGNFGAFQVGRARRQLSCFVLVLSWSRAMYARFALDQTLESFLRGHVEAFEALDGIPREILYDNLKSVVLERIGEHIRFHPRILDLAGHDVHRGAKRIELSPRELMLLKVLMREPARVFTRTELCERVWEHPHEYDTKLVEVFIGRLRRKIGDPPLIHTVRHVGYTLDAREHH